MQIAQKQKPSPGELVLDHLGHFVPDLDAAAAIFEQAGLVVTPVSHHEVSGKPAGTANRCVMLEQGYIELLAPTVDTPQAQRVRERMTRFVGVHLACFGTPDAEGEQRRLAAHGFEPQAPVALERTIDSGERLGFKVIYLPPGRMPEGRVQYVEHLTPQHLWQEGLVNPLSLQALYVAAQDPVQAAARWARFAGLIPRPDGALVRLDTARGTVFIGAPADVAALLGPVPAAPALAGYALGCADPDAFVARCAGAGLSVRGRAVRLPEALGGAWLVTGPR